MQFPVQSIEIPISDRKKNNHSPSTFQKTLPEEELEKSKPFNKESFGKKQQNFESISSPKLEQIGLLQSDLNLKTVQIPEQKTTILNEEKLMLSQNLADKKQPQESNNQNGTQQIFSKGSDSFSESSSSLSQAPKRDPLWKKCMSAIIQHWSFTTFMTILTIYALFGDDIRLASTSKPTDVVFYSLSIVCLFFFSFEIFISCFCKDHYWLGFFFWLDLMSTFSLIPDIGWIWDPIIQTSNTSNNAAQSTQIARAGRASRAGTRAGRVIRIIRLIRLIRIVKLYKLSQQAIKDQIAQEENQEANALVSQKTRKSNSSATDQLESQKVLIVPRRKSNRVAVQQSTIYRTEINSERYSMINMNPPNEENKQEKEKEIKLPKIKPNSIVGDGQLEEFRQKETEGINESIQDPKQKDNEELESIDSKNSNRMTMQQIYNYQKQPQEEENENENDKNLSIVQTYQPQPITSIQQAALIKQFKEQSSEQQDEVEIPDESKVGKKLSELTTKRVIILVLAMMFGLSLFESGTYVQDNNSYKYGLQVIDYFIQNKEWKDLTYAYSSYIELHKDTRNPLLYVELENIYAGIQNPWESDTNYQDLRTNEIEYVFITSNQDYQYNSMAVFDLRADTKLQAILSILRTTFICIVLAAGSILFSKDTNDIILGPIENMIQKVTKISKNPLKAAQEQEEEEFNKQLYLQENKDKKKKNKKKEMPMETEFLEKTIIQIGALLALGFGEAGSEVIAQNMSSGGGEVNPMIPGKKTQAIFGFCDIRNFTDATEVLQEGVMVFVNEIAEIVHSVVDLFSGSANKNIGDAFLLVWKFPEESLEALINTSGDIEVRLNVCYEVQQVADMALISFIKIISKTNRSPKLIKYRQNEKLRERLGDYKVRMGFGLHYGWSIEGAIGSEFKIDASYLSPNVNMAARLEAATKQFGVQLLLSGQIVSLFSDEVQDELRQIDRVTVKGSNVPLDLYTFDMDVDHLEVDLKENTSQDSKEVRKKKKIVQKIRREGLRKASFDQQQQTPVFQIIFQDQDIINMRKFINRKFLKLFSKGFQQYLKGNWRDANKIFLETLKQRHNGEDGPSKTLLEVIQESKGEVPKNWQGFRVLTEK